MVDGVPGGVGGRGLGAYSQLRGNRQRSEGVPENDLTTAEGRKAENEARVQRNEEREVRRHAGEADVEEDEELLDLAPEVQEEEEERRAPRIPQVPNGSTVQLPPLLLITPQEMMAMLDKAGEVDGDDSTRVRDSICAVFQGLAGGLGAMGKSQSSVSASGSTATVGVLIGDKPGSTMFGGPATPDPRLGATLDSGYHVPLSMCTPEAIQAVEEGIKTLEMLSAKDAEGRKLKAVDPSVWPDERTLTPSQWKDAYPNLLEVMKGRVQESVIRRFRYHFEYLSNQPNFNDRFPGILRFDIALRRRYFQNKRYSPFRVDSPEYRQELMQSCADQNARELRALREQMGSVPAVPRFHPYSRDDRQDRRGGGAPSGGGGAARGAPFQAGRAPVSAGFLCLVCGTSGHRADGCTRSKTAKNGALYARWADGKLITAAGGAGLCARWNARGFCDNNSCKSAAPGAGHACSICGSADHHAAGRRCLGA